MMRDTACFSINSDISSRIRDSGVFHSVSHSNWEQEEDNGTVRIHTSVRAVLKEGEQDENK